ncbi:unnamed protein product, partial [Polarella glacialis]
MAVATSKEFGTAPLDIFKVMLCGGAAVKVDGADDGEEWQCRCLPALRGIGVEQEILGGVLDVLSATLLCGEIRWGEGEEAVCSTPGVLADLAELLGVEARLLE